MKSFRIALWGNDRKQPGSSQPDARGLIDIPASVVAELYSYLQAGQGMKPNQGGEQCFQLRVSAWRGAGGNAPVISGQIETLGEAMAYQQQRQAAPANGNGADFLAPAQQPAPAAAPAYVPSAQQPPLPAGFPAQMYGVDQAAPQPAPAAAPVPVQAAPAPMAQPAPWQAPELPRQAGNQWATQPPAAM